MYRAAGFGGSLTVDGDFVVVEGRMGRHWEMPVAHINAIEVNQASWFAKGRVRLIIPGATFVSPTVYFNRKQQPALLYAVSLIRERMRHAQPTQTPGNGA